MRGQGRGNYESEFYMNDFKNIKSEDLIPLFLTILPELKHDWEEHLTYWGNEKRCDYIDLAVLDHFIINSYEKKTTDKFPEFFNLIENLLKSGSAEIQGLVVVGILEDIQTISTHYDFGPDVFVHWLGPVSKKAWLEIAELWKDKQSLADIVRDEVKQSKKRKDINPGQQN